MATRKRTKQKSEAAEQKGARPFWSGTLTFGLVSVPVDLYPGNRTNRAPLRMLGPEHEPLARRSYFLAPAEGSEKAYRLLVETMEKSHLSGIATFVMRGREYLVAIFPENGILRAETMRFSDELRSPKEVGLPEKKDVPAATVKKFERLITKHSV